MDRELKIYKVWCRYMTASQARGMQQQTIAAETEEGALAVMQALIEHRRGEKIAFTKTKIHEVKNG